ncbi:MAG: hypothetical protein E7399_08050 [Ruminococcaceae bacterium]|nr:hypothetical protein [Oscillospiraceae bacterium]
MTKFLKGNGMLKLFSVLVAILLWLYVVQIENPQFEVSVQGVAVRLMNEGQLKANNLMIVEQSAETMNLRLKGKRQSVIGLKSSDVSASIDVETIQQPGSYSFSPQLSFPDDTISVLEKEPRSITITVDAKETRTFDITTETVGVAKDGYYAERPVADMKEVQVTGPAITLDQIAKISASVDLDGAVKDIKKKVKLKIWTKDGTELQSDQVELAVSVVALECRVYPTKQLTLKYDVTGSLDVEGYSLKETTISNPTVIVAGRAEQLEKLETINVGTFDLSEVTLQNSKQVFSIPLPESIISVDGIKNVSIEAVLVSD